MATSGEDLCHTHVSHKWLSHWDASAGSVQAPHDSVINAHERLGNRSYTGEGGCRLCGTFLDPQLEHGDICSTAEATRCHYACVHAVLGVVILADPGVTEPGGLAEAQSRPADTFTAATVLGRSAALDVCEASSNAVAARRDAAQAAFERKTSYYRRKIPVLRAEGIACRSLVWTADGHTLHPHGPCSVLLMFASCRNGQQLSAKGSPAQMETRNTNCPPAKSSNDANGPTKHIRERAMASGPTRRHSHQPLESSTPTRWRR